jgi:lysozyme
MLGASEGLSLKTYLDVAKIPTYCYGETRNAKMGRTYTKPECDALLIDRAIEHEQGMRKCMKAPDAVPEPSYVAFTSFTYNLGIGTFCKSTLARKLNAGDLRGACNELPKFNRAAGVVWKGLVIRRAEEKALCLKGLS